MATITLQIPDSLEKERDDIVRFIAAKLYEAGRLSLGEAAEMVSLSKREFAELLSNYDVSLLNYNVSEMLSDADIFSVEEMKVEGIKSKLKGFTFNSDGYKFDRDEANDYN